MERQRRWQRHRSVRVALVLAVTLVATAAVGYGGVAAWQAYSDNPNSVGAGSLGHQNSAAGTTCTSVFGTTMLNQGTDQCVAVIDVSGASISPSAPDPPAPMVSGTVQITGTGQLRSTFTLSMLNPPAGGLCADLLLGVTDLNTGTPDSGTVYPDTALTSQIGTAADPAVTLYPHPATAGAVWPGTSPGPAGTDTFTVSIVKGPSFNADSQDAGQSCSFDLLFTQQAD